MSAGIHFAQAATTAAAGAAADGAAAEGGIGSAVGLLSQGEVNSRAHRRHLV
ncbi:MAG: hypothetical protein AAFV96_05130 [Pseudomonadota bacterium]